MTNKIICLLSAALLLFSCTVEKQSSGPVSIIPQPKFFQQEEGVFTLDRKTPIYVDVADSATLRTLAFLNDRLEKPVYAHDLSRYVYDGFIAFFVN